MADNQENTAGQLYWKANLKIIMIVLGIWAFVSYGCGIIFAPFLNNFYLGSLPIGFWFAQQGSMYVFIILIFAYAILMDKTDKEFNVYE
jgi:putative solute:sodium symporter small subunit